MRERRVLLGFAESLAAIESAWSLLDAGFEVTAFARAGARPPLRHHRAVRVVEVSAPERDTAAAVTAMRALITAESPTVVLPLDDAAVWLLERAADSGAAVLAGPAGPHAALALDRADQLRLARGAGFAVPVTDEVASPEAALEAIRAAEDDATRFPIVVRPAAVVTEIDGRLVRRSTRVCADLGEVRAALDGWGPRERVLLQPYLAGRGEGVFGLAVDGELHAVSAHERVRMMNPAGSGSSACSSAPPQAELRAATERLVAQAGWEGLVMAELLRDRTGTAWFIELNGRPWGSMALARRCGLEYPAWTVRARLERGFTPPQPEQRAGIVCRHAGRELVHLAFALRGPPSRALADGWPSRARAAREILRIRRGERWYNCRAGARMVFLTDTLSTLARALRGAGG